MLRYLFALLLTAAAVFTLATVANGAPAFRLIPSCTSFAIAYVMTAPLKKGE